MTITQKLRFEVFERDEFICCYCGRHSPKIALEVDHMVSKKHGGGDEMENLITSCFECNRGKGSRSINLNDLLKKIQVRTKKYIEKKEDIKLRKKIEHTKTESLVANYIKWSRHQKLNKQLICELCGQQKKRTKELVCHHIIPVKKDGSNIEMLMSAENILVICHECNELMQGKPIFNRMTGEENKLYNFSKLEPHYNRLQLKRLINK